MSDAEVAAIVDSLESWWDDVDSSLGFEYDAVDASRIGSPSDGITCDGVGIDLDEVEENAWVDPECSEGLTIAYDEAYLTSSLAVAEGTLAHEWGHVIQAQAPELDVALWEDGLPIDGELQADCFAGAWAAVEAEADTVGLREDVALSADEPGYPIDEDDAHGSEELRLAAFDLGHEAGVHACIDDLVSLLPAR